MKTQHNQFVPSTPTVPTASAPGGRPLGIRHVRKILARRVVIMVIVNVVFVILVATRTPNFLTVANFKVIVLSMALEAIVLAAMTWLLVSGMFDLSVDGVVNMSGVLCGTLIARGYDYRVAIIVALVAGSAVGLVNGLAVTKLRANALMTTLATWWITQGIAYGLTSGYPSSAFPAGFQRLGGPGPLGLDLPVWYMIIAVPILGFILARTKFGWHIYAMGGNREAARLHGIRVDRRTIICFVVVAAAAAFAGVILAARLNTASPIAVSGLNLRVIGGAVIGGTSLYGGTGGVSGAFLGLLFMEMTTNASVVLGISPYWQYVILGVVLLVAVAADAVAAGKLKLR